MATVNWKSCEGAGATVYPQQVSVPSSGVTGRGGRGKSAPRDFPLGNFWRLIRKNEAKKKGKKSKIHKKMRKNGEGKEENEEKIGEKNAKGKEENEKCKEKRTDKSS